MNDTTRDTTAANLASSLAGVPSAAITGVVTGALGGTSASASAPTVTRTVERIVRGVPTSDGAGVKLTRVLTQDLQRRLDPFLMLDAFGSDNADDYIAGFPNHPHRGFETVTYMLDGVMKHSDNHGGEGILGAGGVQWMTAGRGIVHSEIPQQDHGRMAGFQLWLNLPGKDKLTAPGYKDLPDATIPVTTTDNGVRIKVIAGRANGVEGAIGDLRRSTTDPYYLDIHMPANARLEQDVPEGHNAFVYVYEGDVAIGDPAATGNDAPRPVRRGEMGILSNRSGAAGVIVESTSPARLLLIAGKPLGEPIAQYGPFVMNTQDELRQTFADYQAGRF
jgi:redox-sensitive bicupin YhaK (pirin superfamily)